MAYWIPSLVDYDTAIIEKMRQIKVDINNDGNLQPIHVTFFSPEHEGQPDADSLRPAVVVFMYDQSHDIRREQSVITEYVTNTPTDVTTKTVPTPTKFFYQFTIITDYVEHMNEIIQQINKLFPTRGYITVTSPDGEQLSYDFFQKGVSNGFTNQFLEFGKTDAERTFRKLYKYHLYAEQDESIEHTYKKVNDVTPTVREVP